MKNLNKTFLIFSTFIMLNSCKECIECQYSSTKGTQIEKFCSSTKSDREAFEQEQDSIATYLGGTAVCEKVKF